MFMAGEKLPKEEKRSELTYNKYTLINYKSPTKQTV